MKYKNRYGDVFTFTEDENHDVLWTGNFEYCRIGMPNDYTKAYQAYLDDKEELEEVLSLEEFKTDVHVYEGDKYLYPEYVRLIESLKDEIDMVDPSGGPYISRGMKLNSFGFIEYVVKDFKKIDNGYKIIIEKCPLCHLPAHKHKMSCSSQKITMFYDQMEKEVHKNNNNLNQ
jgi:hypothetical protein